MTEAKQVPGGDQRSASTLELFFDLVYVFAITQVVAAVHSEPTFVGLLAGAFLLWLLWWTWSNYTWTTNWTGTDGTPVRLFLITAMGATLFMAMAVPDAFGDGSQWFGIAYFLVRILAAGLYYFASRDHPDQREAFFTFFPLSFTAALLILIGGFLPGPWLWALWIASAILDFVSALSAGRGTWAVDAKHFAERNGLFVIIALGESIVGIGLTAVGVERDLLHTTTIALSFILAAVLWWSYFDKAAPFAERYFVAATGKEPGRFARDAYSLMHYPLVVGIVFFAVGAEEAVAHPSGMMETVSRVALATGVALVLVSMVGVTYRARGGIVTERIVAGVAIVGVGVVGTTLDARTLLATITVIAIVAIVWEHYRVWSTETKTVG